MIKKIVMVPEIINKLIDRGWDESLPEVIGFEGWTLDSDTDTGTFDSAKGAMTDYKLTLTSPKGEIFTGRGGYYTGVTGEVFDNNVEFTPKPERKKIVMTKEDKDKREYQLYLELKKKYENYSGG